MGTHKEILIRTTLGSRHYEAVGFLEKNEESVSGKEMFARAAKKNNGAIGEQEARHVEERLSGLPVALRRYRLVTKKRHPDNPQLVLCFVSFSNSWARSWEDVNAKWSDGNLVLRRCCL